METKKHKRYKFSGFTLVELIVVITILAILGTISFIQLQGFAGSARDSIRIENLSSLHKGLTLFNTISSTYPMPEGTVTISASGTDIGYQGFAKDTVGGIAKLSKWATQDPSDATIYTTYSVNANQTKIQLMSFLEGGGNITTFVPNAYANMGSDYSKRSPLVKWDGLGILLASGSLQPVQESGTWVDLMKTTTLSGYTLVFSKNDIITSVVTSGTGAYTWSIFTYVYNRQEDLLANKILASNDPSLVGYWDMETLSGELLKDLSGYGNHGVCYNGTASGACGIIWPQIVDGNGKNGRSMSFDGVDDTVVIPKNNSFVLNNLTIIEKIRHSWAPEANNGWGWRILSSQNNTSTNYFFTRIDDSYKNNWITPTIVGRWGLRFVMAALEWEQGTWSAVTSTIMDWNFHTIFDVKWSNIIGYIDGMKKYDYANTLGVIDTQSDVFIWWLNFLNENFSWTIDEVRIYNRALSDPEIQTLYNATK